MESWEDEEMLIWVGQMEDPVKGLGRNLAGAGGAVVVDEGSSVLVDFAVEQTASQRQIKDLPLTCRGPADQSEVKSSR